MKILFTVFVLMLLAGGCSSTFKYNNKEYPSRETVISAFRSDLNRVIEKVAVTSPRLGGSAIIVIPTRDALKQLGPKPSANIDEEHIETGLDFNEIFNLAHTDIVNAGKVFDKTDTARSANTESYSSIGYNYKLWIMGNKNGNWQWYLSKTGFPGREPVNIDTVLTGSRQFDSFNNAVVKAAYVLEQTANTGSAFPNQATGDGKTKSFGTGFFINEEGLALSNAHVIKNCANLVAVLHTNETAPATFVAATQENDLALIKVATYNKAHAQLNISSPMRQGEQIITYGYPLAGALASTGNLSTGIISALAGIKDDIRKLQISAPVQPGNSGGPLLDQNGNVIGVVDSKLNAIKAASMTGDIPQNVNFAIKSNVVANFLDANNIKYDATHASKPLSIEDIGDKAKAFTFKIECQ
ncbi:MAG: serine protease [Methylomonas sp.]|jgi:S1-C subfamily serine protease